MKKILMTLIFICIALTDVCAQRYTSAGETVETQTVNGMTLKRTKSEWQVVVDNVADTKMYRDYVYLNGALAPKSFKDHYPIEDVPMSAFERSVIATFTLSERAQFSKERVFFYLVFDNVGKLLEICFMMDSDTKVSKLPLGKFALWTQNLKKYVKATITDPKTKQLQFVHETVFYFFP